MRRLRLWLVTCAALCGAPVAQAQVAPVAETVMTPVLDHAIAKGDIFGASDFVTQEMPAAQARGVPRLRDIVGMEALRTIPAGSIVRTADLIKPQLVRRGEPVTLVFRDGALSITAEGRALASGAAGDLVRIVNLSTNRTLDGVVEGTGAVRISAR